MGNSKEEMFARVERATEAFNRGDFDAAIEDAHPEIVFVRPGFETVLSGADALRAWMEPDAFESQSIELLESRASGNRLLVRQRMTAKGSTSGIEIDNETLTVWTFDDDGRALRMESFFVDGEDDALRALDAD